MFWGTVIKEGKPFKSQQAMQDKEFSALHISQATLPQGKHEGKIYLTASMGKEMQNLTVAVLSHDKDTCPLDFYINLSQNVTLSVKGKSEVHLTGYMEPSADEDGMMMGNPEEVDYDSEDDEDELENETKDVVGFKGNLKEAKKNSDINAKALKKEESDSEDDDEDDDDLPEEYDDEDEEDMDSDLQDLGESEEAEVDEDGRFEELSDSDEDDKKKSQTKKPEASAQKKP
jgi:nucleophosmin 1